MKKLLNRLEAIAQAVSSMQTVSVEALIQTIEAMNMLENYYTPEQLESLRQRQELLGEERIKQVQAEWQDLFEQVRAEMAKSNPIEQVWQYLKKGLKWKLPFIPFLSCGF